jgi:hypothetical protein
MSATKQKTYDDYLQEARSVTKEQLREMTADWRMPNSDAPVDMKKWANPSKESIQYFGGL